MDSIQVDDVAKTKFSALLDRRNATYTGYVYGKISSWEVQVRPIGSPIMVVCSELPGSHFPGVIVHNISVDRHSRRKGVFTDIMNSLQQMMKAKNTTTCDIWQVILFESVRNKHLYRFLLKQPNIYISRYNMHDCVLLLTTKLQQVAQNTNIARTITEETIDTMEFGYENFSGACDDDDDEWDTDIL